MTYSNTVLQHFFSPKNCHRMTDADAVGRAGRAEGVGPLSIVFLKREGDKIKDASFQAYGCGAAIAAGSVLVEKIVGVTIAEAQSWDVEKLTTAMGGVPNGKEHCVAITIGALKEALGLLVNKMAAP